jgi:ATPase subunit of ABC transporter with duplicated ATPase domains
MTTGAKDGSAPISLFPFLSILACVIGTLILLISALAVGQMGTPSDDSDIRRAEEHDRLQRQCVDEQKRIAEIKKSLDAVLADRSEMSSLQGRRAALEKELSGLKSKSKSDQQRRQKILAEKQNLEQRVKQLDAERGKLAKDLESIQSELDQRLSVSLEGVVKVVPSRNAPAGKRKQMHFVEAAAKGIFIHKGSKPVFVASQKIPSDKGYLSLLDSLKGKPGDLLVFLLRDNGLGVYSKAKKEADKRGLQSTAIPLVGHGSVDLGGFK